MSTSTFCGRSLEPGCPCRFSSSIQIPVETLVYKNHVWKNGYIRMRKCVIGAQHATAMKAETAGPPHSSESSSSSTSSPISAGVANLKVLNEKIRLPQIIEPVSEDLRMLNDNLQSLVGAQNPLLMSAAEQIFSAGGKRMRPAIVFLVARATAELTGQKELTSQHRRLAEVTEMIHTASLIHDDILDDSNVRRGRETVHQMYGTRIAVLAGDFMFAQSSWLLANLDNLEVIKLISQVIRDFASGEIKQAASLFDRDTTLQEYIDKSYFKTASLVAASTRSAAIFSGVDVAVCNKMFDYGRHLGLAFQVIDDILDFTCSSQQLGKPAGSDLSKGNLTAPVLYALQNGDGELGKLIDSEFSDDGSLDAAISLVIKGGGVEKALELAKQEADMARKALDCLPYGPLRNSLDNMVHYVLQRGF